MAEIPSMSVISPLLPTGGSLGVSEYFWRDHQPWLEGCGYMLRSRYHPGWSPSWGGMGKEFFQCDDGQSISHPFILDATRKMDNTTVTLKRTSKKAHPHEQAIVSLFSQPSLKDDLKNHCVPVFETLQVPDDDDTIIIVMPFLRLFNDPPFQTVGEAIDFFDQIIEGLNYMHLQGVAHRDISLLNIMMDPNPMFPHLYHPIKTLMDVTLTKLAKPYTRTECPTKYYYVDFGLSSKFGRQDIGIARDVPVLGGYKGVPEFQGEGLQQPHNPFQTDVFYLGCLIDDCFLQRYSGLEFMDALVSEMTRTVPKERPSATMISEKYAAIRSKVTRAKLRGRLVDRREKALKRLVNAIKHAFHTANYIVRSIPPVPSSRQHRPAPSPQSTLDTLAGSIASDKEAKP